MDDGKRTTEDTLQVQRLTAAMAEQYRLLLELQHAIATARDIRQQLREQGYWHTDAERES